MADSSLRMLEAGGVTLRARWRDPPLASAIGLLLWLTLCACVLLTQGNAAHPLFALYYDMPVGPILAWLSWRLVRVVGVDPRARLGWSLLALAFLSFWLGNVTWNVYEGLLDIDPFPSLADGFYLAFYLLAVAGLLRLTPPLTNRRDFAKFLLDSGAAILSLFGVLWFLTFRFVRIDSSHGAFGTLFSIAYPVADGLLLVAVIGALLKRHYVNNSRVLGCLAGSFTALLCADMTILAPLLANELEDTTLADLFYQASYLLATLGAVIGLTSARTRQVAHEGVYHVQALPYAFVLLAFGLLLWQMRDALLTPSGVLTSIAAVTAVLVLIRQMLAARENMELSALRASNAAEARYQSLVRNSSDIVLIVGPQLSILFASSSITRVLGWTEADAMQRSLSALAEPADQPKLKTFCQTLRTSATAHGPLALRLLRADGVPCDVELTGTNLIADPNVQGLVLNVRDISERKRLEDELKQLAFTDSLTLLANRNLFNEQLARAIGRVARENAEPVLMFVDLDNFKKINDTLGHEAGDKILTMAAQRLIRATRAGDVVARLGGDEFALLIADDAADSYVKQLAERLIAVLSTPFELEGRQLQLSASIGIARAEPGMQPAEFMRNADLAMYKAKEQGKNGYEMYQPAMYANLAQAVDIEAELAISLERHDFVPYFQPIVDLKTQRCMGLEALVRWHHPSRGVLFPSAFIGIAEQSGLIERLGHEILVETFRHVAQWRTDASSPDIHHVAINVSGRQLSRLELVDEVAEALRRFAIPPHLVVLEITESVLMDDVALAVDQLTRLKNLGVRIALDDFGTGYSSLSHVHRFPIDLLKIDRSFIEALTGGDGSALVKAIMGLANALNLQVVAEGIENQAQVEQLMRFDCQLGQGYLFGKPEHPEKMRERLKASHSILPFSTVRLNKLRNAG